MVNTKLRNGFFKEKAAPSANVRSPEDQEKMSGLVGCSGFSFVQCEKIMKSLSVLAIFVAHFRLLGFCKHLKGST